MVSWFNQEDEEMGRVWHGVGRDLTSLKLVLRPSLAEGPELNWPVSPTKHVRNAKSWRGWTRLPAGSINNWFVGISSLERRPVMCWPHPRAAAKVCGWLSWGQRWTWLSATIFSDICMYNYRV